MFRLSACAGQSTVCKQQEFLLWESEDFERYVNKHFIYRTVDTVVEVS